MDAIERQNELLRQIADADDADDDLFFTSSTTSGTRLIHSGLPDQHQLPIAGMGSIEGLSQRGLIRITERRSHGDVAFALTPEGRTAAERLRHGGRTEVEAQRDRAERAEAALRRNEEQASATEIARQESRERLAGNLAWLIAAALAIGLGYVLLTAAQSTDKTVAFIVGVALAAGVTGWVLAAPLRALVARLIARLLLAIHDRT